MSLPALHRLGAFSSIPIGLVTGRPGRGNHFGRNALTCMEYELREKPPVTKEERAAKKEKTALEAEQALKERKKADAAFRANFERLKAERLAREAANS